MKNECVGYLKEITDSEVSYQIYENSNSDIFMFVFENNKPTWANIIKNKKPGELVFLISEIHKKGYDLDLWSMDNKLEEILDEYKGKISSVGKLVAQGQAGKSHEVFVNSLNEKGINELFYTDY